MNPRSVPANTLTNPLIGDMQSADDMAAQLLLAGQLGQGLDTCFVEHRRTYQTTAQDENFAVLGELGHDLGRRSHLVIAEGERDRAGQQLFRGRQADLR
jgi:hypothetical protein